MNRRQFLLGTAAAATAGSLGLAYYTWAVEPHWVEIVERDLPIAHLPERLTGARLVHLSDLHVGPHVDDDFLISSFDRVAALRPEIVVITGDFLTHRASRGARQFDQMRDVLSHLPRARWATLGILGNHDHGRNWREPDVAARVARVTEHAGVWILRNETASVRGLDVIGVDDIWSGQADLAQAFRDRTSEAAIALCHNPDGVDELPWGEYQGWVLAGHTHGGQCKPPFLPPPLLPVRNRRYTAGEIAIAGGRRLYISRGLGHWFRVRFNVRPEITVFTLRRANAA